MQHSAQKPLSALSHLDPHRQLPFLPSAPLDEGSAKMDSPLPPLLPQPPLMP